MAKQRMKKVGNIYQDVHGNLVLMATVPSVFHRTDDPETEILYRWVEGVNALGPRFWEWAKRWNLRGNLEDATHRMGANQPFTEKQKHDLFPTIHTKVIKYCTSRGIPIPDFPARLYRGKIKDDTTKSDRKLGLVA